MTETTYLQAITTTLAGAMRADERVLVLGEDVAEGGPWGATAGLADEFGAERVRNTPISEAAICGIAIGAAQSGLRPVVEIMFIDFLTLALDQLVNQAAKAHFMSGGQLQVPLVLRTQGGAGQRGAAQHSQIARGVADARARVEGRDAEHGRRRRRPARAAIADPNPVVVIENKTLYFRARAGVRVPRGDRQRQDRSAGTGCDGRRALPSRPRGGPAAEELAEEGIEVEVIDPRTLVPLDLETIVESVSRTHRLVVAHEAVESGGFGAEITAPGAARRVRRARRAGRARWRAVRADPVQPAARGRVPPGPRRGEQGGTALSRRLRPDRLGAVSILGNRVLRKEDGRFLRGEGTYVENLPLEGARVLTFVRSPFAHAKITIVDTSAAADLPGVEVLTGADVDVAPIAPPPIPLIEPRMLRPAVAKDVVRFVGEIVAVVVSDDRATGVDAAELVMVDYDPLPAVIDPDEALKDELLLFPDVGTNIAVNVGPPESDETLFDGCEVIVSDTLVSPRMAGCPLEVRSAAAEVGEDGRLTAWLSTQVPHQDQLGPRRHARHGARATCA